MKTEITFTNELADRTDVYKRVAEYCRTMRGNFTRVTTYCNGIQCDSYETNSTPEQVLAYTAKNCENAHNEILSTSIN